MSRFRLWHSLRQRLGRPRDSAYDDLSVFQPTLVTDWRGVSTPPAADSDSVWAMPSAPGLGVGAASEMFPDAAPVGRSAQARRLESQEVQAAQETRAPGAAAARRGGAPSRTARRQVPVFDEDSMLDIVDDEPPAARPPSPAARPVASTPASQPAQPPQPTRARPGPGPVAAQPPAAPAPVATSGAEGSPVAVPIHAPVAAPITPPRIAATAVPEPDDAGAPAAGPEALGSDAVAAAERAFGRPLRHPVSPYESREAAYRRSQRTPGNPVPAATGLPAAGAPAGHDTGHDSRATAAHEALHPMGAAAPAPAAIARPPRRGSTGLPPRSAAAHAAAHPAARAERPPAGEVEIITPQARPQGPGRGPEPIAPASTGFGDTGDAAQASPMARAVPWLGPAAMALAAIGAIGWGYQQLVEHTPPPAPAPASPLPLRRVASAPARPLGDGMPVAADASASAAAAVTTAASSAGVPVVSAASAASATGPAAAPVPASVTTASATAPTAPTGREGPSGVKPPSPALVPALAPATSPTASPEPSPAPTAGLPVPGTNAPRGGVAPQTVAQTVAQAAAQTTAPAANPAIARTAAQPPALPGPATPRAPSQATPSPTATPSATPTTGRTRSVPASGHIVAWQEVVVAAEQPIGRLTELHAQVGQWVRRGQLLASFAAETARADLAQADARLAEAEAALLAAQADAQRARQVQGSGALSAQAVNQMLTAEQTAKARLRAAQAGSQAQKLRLEQAQVRAPFDGLVLQRPATVGAVPAPGAELYRLLRDGRLEWRAELPAAELAALPPGTPARLSLPDGRVVQGQVRLVDPQVDPRTRTGIVHVELPAGAPVKPGETPVLQLRPGLLARGELQAPVTAAPATAPVAGR
ncbi:efflux RND transporter periplasmic adaptor subunit [Pseudaquabacterium rugosum]|uniref:Efflux RND transporter periplasmic adaptor subunit n=1 Tax=Pseudaquabacterium rugosum TaxID=2984194 RepID=A0ABU9B5T5_9BURK